MKKQPPPRLSFIIVTIGIISTEFFIHLTNIERYLPFGDSGSVIVETAIMVTIISPFLYYFSILPLEQRILEEVRSQQKIADLNRLYKTLSACNHALVHAESEEHLLENVCHTIEEEGGYYTVTARVKKDDGSWMVLPIAKTTNNAEYPNTATVESDSSSCCMDATNTAINTGRISIDNKVECPHPHEPHTQTTHSSVAAIPITLNGETIGALTILAKETDAFTDDRIRLLGELSEDISFGIRSLREKAMRIKGVAELIEAKSDAEKERAIDDAILASLGEGMLALDKNGYIFSINNKAKSMTGFSESDCIGKKMTDIIIMLNVNKGPIPHEQHPVTMTLKTKVAVTSDVLYVAQKSGNFIPIIATITPIILNKESIGVVTIIRDITKEMEIEKTRGDLLALASHQLRTPLSGTKWLIETLQRGIKGPLNSEQMEYLTEIYNINQRMTLLVSDMLGVLRLEGGAEQLSISSISTNKILDTVQETFAPVAELKRIKLVIQRGSEETIETDPTILRNIIESFVSNAINYSEPGGEVTVALNKDEQNITFVVNDTGIGIPQECQSQIFERFYRASNAKTFNTNGTGLGLYIAATFAKKIGAKIFFESECSKGSTFYVSLPLSTDKPLPETPSGV